MKRKLISLILAFTMLVSLSSAVAADDTSATPTVEEILNEYHQKAFEAQLEGETGTASTWSHRGYAKTLEQETVDALTVAGYEAYNVTSDNYDSLEADLNTDFASMGLDPDGSYIVVIEGDDKTKDRNAGTNSRISPEIDLEGPDWIGGGSTFKYYDGQKIYTMRYVTITEADAEGEGLYVEDMYTLSNIQYLEEFASIFDEFIVETICDKFIEEASKELVDEIPFIGTICSIASLLGEVYETVTQDPLQLVHPETLVFRAATAWTHSYIQVYNEETSYWHTSQCSTYAIARAHFDAGYVYDPVTNAPVQVGGILQDTTIYSPYYENTDERKARAVIGYKNGYSLFDGTGDIDFFFTNPNDPNPDTNKIYLFSHTQCLAFLLAEKEPG